MIVACPSCRTRYRHSEAPAEASTAQCSQCNETFPLTQPRRSYVLVPEGVAPGTFPTHDLAEGTPEVPPPADWPTPVPPEASGADSPGQDSGGADVMDADGQAATGGAGTRSVIPGLLAGLAGAAGLGALAYTLGGTQGANLNWTVAGAVVGFVVGWGGVQWMRPKG